MALRFAVGCALPGGVRIASLAIQSHVPVRFHVLLAPLRHAARRGVGPRSGVARFLATEAEKVGTEKLGLWKRRIKPFLLNPIVRRVVRLTRVTAMLGSLGFGAYAVGQMEVVDDPEGYSRKALMSILLGEGVEVMMICTDTDDLKRMAKRGQVDAFAYVVDEEARTIDCKPAKHDNYLWQTALICQKVFVQVKKGAMQYMDDEVTRLQNNTQLRTSDPEEWRSQSETAINRRSRLNMPWTMIITADPNPNAMVHGFLPRHVFVTTGLLEQFAHDKDQLAMVLAHELSHYLHGHNLKNVKTTAIIQGIMVTMLSMIDPSGGLAGFVVELLIPKVGQALIAENSRHHECEADATGLTIANYACFDPDRAVAMFDNMQKFDEEHGRSRTRMMDSHPVSFERVAAAKITLAELKNTKRAGYTAAKCDAAAKAMKRITEMGWLRPEGSKPKPTSRPITSRLFSAGGAVALAGDTGADETKPTSWSSWLW